jgi:hypothetical protein
MLQYMTYTFITGSSVGEELSASINQVRLMREGRDRSSEVQILD